jgi:hypothetical protein
LVATLTGVHERDSGLASALNDASVAIGRALGAAVATSALLANTSEPGPLLALTHGLQSAFGVALAVAALRAAHDVLERLRGEPDGIARASLQSTTALQRGNK